MGHRAASVAAVCSLLLISIGCVAVVSAKERHQLGTNYVRPVAFVAELPAGARLCQPDVRIPAGTGGVGLRIGTFNRPGPALRLAIRAPGAPVVRGALAPGWRQGDVVVPVPELAAERRDASVCLEHDGPGALAIAGGPGIGKPSTRDGVAGDTLIRLEYVEPDPETWFQVIPELGDRLAVARDALPAQVGAVLFIVLAAGVLGGALALVVREGGR